MSPTPTFAGAPGVMAGKTCIVTGASNGIGKETAGALAGMGARVVMVCRSAERGERALADIAPEASGAALELVVADLSSQADVRRAAGDLLARCPRIDVLVNNAGALNTSRTLTADGYETTFATNHLAYFLLTQLLLERLRASAPARVINVSSRAHAGARINFDDLHFERGYSPMTAYGQSKLANVLFTRELARRLDGSGVTANCLHPGVVRTGFGKGNPGAFGGIVSAVMNAAGVFFLDAKRGADTSIYLASSPEVEGVTGAYFFKRNAITPSDRALDDEAARRLWEISEQLTGIVPGSG